MASAEGSPTIEFHLRFASLASHRLEVEASYPAGGTEELELAMAVWTPGSYLVREYSRNLEALTAGDEGGRGLPVRKTSKNRWRVQAGGAERVVVRYRLYCRELSVRGNWIDEDFALLNGAATFLTPLGGRADPHRVRMDLPEGWERVLTSLPEVPEEDPWCFVAEDYDELVDSPILAGSPHVKRFLAGGARHELVHAGDTALWDLPRTASDFEAIVREEQAFWGDVPYERYVLLNLITEGGGGLEHRASTVIMTSRWKARVREGYLDWLGLVAHELFHTWNGKRLRPAEHVKIDYEGEVYSESLWIVEGITTYYTDLVVHRAGLTTREEYLARLSRHVERLERVPGRRVQSLEEASFDAWIKLYRPDENTANATVSYYTKGAVAAFLLDARIRSETRGERSLDDVLRLAYERFPPERGFREEELRGVAEEVAGSSLASWFEEAVGSTADLDPRPALATFGLRWAGAPGGGPGGGAGGAPDRSESARAGEAARARAWLGVGTRDEGGRVVVTDIRRGVPADESGLDAGDELIALGGYRLGAGSLEQRLEHYEPGERVELLVARRGRIRSVEVALGTQPPERRLEVDPGASNEQKNRLEAWLAPSAERRDRSGEKRTI